MERNRGWLRRRGTNSRAPYWTPDSPRARCLLVRQTSETASRSS